MGGALAIGGGAFCGGEWPNPRKFAILSSNRWPCCGPGGGPPCCISLAGRCTSWNEAATWLVQVA
jgi:hypothetical protein